MVGVVQADLISGLFETILFGIFFVLSTTSLALLLRRHRYTHRTSADSRSTSRWSKWATEIWSWRRSPLIAANILLMVTITAVSVLLA